MIKGHILENRIANITLLCTTKTDTKAEQNSNWVIIFNTLSTGSLSGSASDSPL